MILFLFPYNFFIVGLLLCFLRSFSFYVPCVSSCVLLFFVGLVLCVSLGLIYVCLCFLASFCWILSHTTALVPVRCEFILKLTRQQNEYAPSKIDWPTLLLFPFNLLFLWASFCTFFVAPHSILLASRIVPLFLLARFL